MLGCKVWIRPNKNRYFQSVEASIYVTRSQRARVFICFLISWRSFWCTTAKLQAFHTLYLQHDCYAFISILQMRHITCNKINVSVNVVVWFHALVAYSANGQTNIVIAIHQAIAHTSITLLAYSYANFINRKWQMNLLKTIRNKNATTITKTTTRSNNLY